MILYPNRLKPEETLHFNEILPATILELEEPLVRQHGPVHVNLSAVRDDDAILVTGSVETVLQVCCGRCADWIDWPVNISEFLLLIEPPFEDTIDLTQNVREDILLDLPVAAACRLDHENSCPLSGKVYVEASEPPPIERQEAWSELDKLKVKE